MDLTSCEKLSPAEIVIIQESQIYIFLIKNVWFYICSHEIKVKTSIFITSKPEASIIDPSYTF